MIRFTGIPNFAPEYCAASASAIPPRPSSCATPSTTWRRRGSCRCSTASIGAQWIVGVVGQLQLDVLISRLQAEYKVDAGFEPSPWDTARWVTADDPKALDEFAGLHRAAMAEDRDGAPVFLAKDAWELNYVTGRHPALRFAATKDRR